MAITRWDPYRDLLNLQNERTRAPWAPPVEASFNKGVLTVTIPKAELAKPRRIEIEIKAGA